MKTYFECFPCFFRQALEIGRLLNLDDVQQKEFINEVAALIPRFSLDSTPPEMAQRIYQVITAKYGRMDPYREIKQRSNRLALELYPEMEKIVSKSEDRLLTAVEIAIAGNIIDYGVKNNLDIEQEIAQLLKEGFVRADRRIFDYGHFTNDLKSAGSILYIGDNAGEIVFDKLLVQELLNRDKTVVFGVRGQPIINDAVMEDARACGLDQLIPVVSSGLDAPGTILNSCSREFRDIFARSDLIISKGQGNFETLSDEPANIYFLFKAKCPVVADKVGAHLGDIVLKKCR